MKNFLNATLENDSVILQHLNANDFERLYLVASDPKIWEQHPNPDRYLRSVFQVFFDGAMASGAAFVIIDKATGEVAGSTRFYNYDGSEKSIFIGYTFYATKFWGSKLNPQVKKFMLEYIFEFVDLVKFHVGKENFRSRKAMEKLGAKLHQEVSVDYHAEPTRENVEYWIKKSDWQNRDLSGCAAV